MLKIYQIMLHEIGRQDIMSNLERFKLIFIYTKIWYVYNNYYYYNKWVVRSVKLHESIRKNVVAILVTFLFVLATFRIQGLKNFPIIFFPEKKMRENLVLIV